MYLGGYDSQKLHYETRGYVPCYKELVNDTEIQKDAVVAVVPGQSKTLPCHVRTTQRCLISGQRQKALVMN